MQPRNSKFVRNHESIMEIDEKAFDEIIILSDESSLGEAAAEDKKKHVNGNQRKQIAGVVILENRL